MKNRKIDGTIVFTQTTFQTICSELKARGAPRRGPFPTVTFLQCIYALLLLCPPLAGRHRPQIWCRRFHGQCPYCVWWNGQKVHHYFFSLSILHTDFDSPYPYPLCLHILVQRSKFRREMTWVQWNCNCTYAMLCEYIVFSIHWAAVDGL